MGLVAGEVVPVMVGFFEAAVLILLSGVLTLKEAYDSIVWPILSCSGPHLGRRGIAITRHGSVAAAVRRGTLTASHRSVGADVGGGDGGYAVSNNAATVLVMAPIAASFAASWGSMSIRS